MTIQWRLSLAAGILGTILAGCSPAPVQPVQQPVDRAQQARIEIEKLLNQAEQAPPIQAAQFKVQAANILLRMGREDAAYSILSDVDLAFLPPSLRYEIAQIRARSALDEQDPALALRYLEIPTGPDGAPSLEQATRISELRAEAFRLQNDPTNEALELIELSRQSYDDEQRQLLHNQTWLALNKLSLNQLADLSRETGNTYYEQGWFELALIYKQRMRLDARNEAINEWNVLWESHPARLLPPITETAVSADPINAQRVAVLLPMQGKLAKAGAAIREGLLAAYFDHRSNGKSVPELQFLDSTQVDQPEALRALITERNIDVVIGPLAKNYVQALNSSEAMPVPVLALNYDQDASLNQIFQFGLAAEDEARQAARQAWNDGHRIVLALVPQTSWGTRVRRAFAEEFEGLGGRLADSGRFDKQENFSQDISTLLATDKSKERAKQVFRMSNQKIKFEERRRKDVDAIFLSALPGDARQIKPILAFHYAGDLPVYATSHVYAGNADAKRDRDLNGINFVDIPWTLSPASSTKRFISQKREDTDTRFGRLYALGADAFQIFPYLYQLSASEGAAIEGETGSLSIDENKRVVRNLKWARFRKGNPALLN